ncbi:MAG TPA: hypothetical protein VFU02_05860, partial [Polyangiaceae bacterium]|nr:hypothetical protein [Polyangiaceae bacterium]
AQLMSSRRTGSEQALATFTCERIREHKRPHILIGGLGMGFTLAAALRRLGPEARVVVAELIPSVVAWNRGVLGEVAGCPLDDPRVRVHEGDVAELIRAEQGAWDAILLDVDNGPTGLTQAANDELYSLDGLMTAFSALRPGGVLGVWSAGVDTGFTQRMTRAGFDVATEKVRSRGARGGRRHVVWLGTRHPERPLRHRARPTERAAAGPRKSQGKRDRRE